MPRHYFTFSNRGKIARPFITSHVVTVSHWFPTKMAGGSRPAWEAPSNRRSLASSSQHGCTFSRHFFLFLFMPLLNGEHSGTESRPAIRFLPEKGRCPGRPAAHCLSIGTLILMMGPREQRGSSTAQPTAGGAEAGGWKGAYGLPCSRTKGQRDIQVSWALCIDSAIFLEPWPLEKHG